MATWTQLQSHIHATYQATDISPRAIEMLFGTTEGRDQLVWVTSAVGPHDEEWAMIDSPVGDLGAVDLVQALLLVEGAVCGGLAHLDVRGRHLVTVRHCVPLLHLDAPEFDNPLRLVIAAADDFERQLTGKDLL